MSITLSQTKRVATAGHGHAATSLSAVVDDALHLVFSHLCDADLTAAACANHHFSALAAFEAGERAWVRARARARARREKRSAKQRARERFAAYEDDARVVATVIRHAVMHAPRNVSKYVKDGRKSIATSPSGVYRLRVGVDGAGSVTSERPADRVVDALAVQESALHKIAFEGEPLGAQGAAVALRQATKLRLGMAAGGRLHGRAFKLVVPIDTLFAYMEASPALARLLCADD